MKKNLILPICSVIVSIGLSCLCYKTYELEKKKVFLYDQNYQLEKIKFLVSLNKSFYNDSEFQILLDHIDRGSGLSTNDYTIASRYLDYFEPFYLLIKEKQLDIAQVDDMFAYRFFAVVNDAEIQSELISPHYSYYGNIFKLHKCWVDYRKSNQRILLQQIKDDLSNDEHYMQMCQEA